MSSECPANVRRLSTSSPLRAAELLERIVDGHAAGAINPADLETVVEAFAQVLEGDAETLDKALGFVPAPGLHRPGTISSRSRRDALLREAAARFWPNLPRIAQAVELHRTLRRYHSTAWQRERALRSCPNGKVGTIYEFCWRILKARDQILSVERLRKLLVEC